MGYANLIYIDLFSAAIILTVLVSTGRPSLTLSRGVLPDMVIYTYLSLSVFLILILEGFLWFVEGYPQTIDHNFLQILYVLYYSLHLVPASLYILYADCHLTGSSRRQRAIAKVLIPVNLAVVFFSIISPWTGVLFIIDQANTYSRGTGIYIFNGALVLVTLGGVMLLFLRHHTRNLKTTLTLLLFPSLVVTAGIIQTFFYGLSVTWPTVVIFLIAAPLNIQKVQIFTDHLTGLLNRRNFEQKLELEMARARRNGEPLSLILLDIDHFKKINDTYGHDIGDTIITSIAAILSNHSRPSDAVARWGGEEFTMLLPNTCQSDAELSAERIRSEIENSSFTKGINTTLSAGVAQWLQIEGKQILFKRVDRALYRAKDLGRNRVEECPWIQTIPVGSSGFEWSESYETGNSQVDEEHRELFSIALKFLEHIEDGQSRSELREELKKALHTHFIHEENLMRESGYPELSNHAQIHERLKKKADETFNELEQGLYDNFNLFFIEEIIIEHLLKEDKPFVQFMQKKSQV